MAALRKAIALFAFSSGMVVGEGDARGVVDADIDELPAGAFTSGPCVALPAAVAGDAVADLAEAAELLDVDVDELAGVLAFVAPHRLGRLGPSRRLRPARLRMRLTVAGETPAALAMCWPGRRRRRDHLIDDGRARRLSSALGVMTGRSIRPALRP